MMMRRYVMDAEFRLWTMTTERQWSGPDENGEIKILYVIERELAEGPRRWVEERVAVTGAKLDEMRERFLELPEEYRNRYERWSRL